MDIKPPTTTDGPTGAEDGQVDPASGALSRRRMIGGAAVGAGALWVAPSIVGMTTPAAAASICPNEVVTARDVDYGPRPFLGSAPRSITLSPTGLQAGDVWVMIAAYRGGDTINTPTGITGLSGPLSTTGGGTDIYSVRVVVYWKTLVATDLTAGTFTAAVTTSSDGITSGGLRAACTAFRAGSAISGSGGATNTGNGGTATFPAPLSVPSSNFITVRLGASRGFGGCGGTSNWTSPPATSLVNYNTGNTGDRAIVISASCNDAGTATGTWNAPTGPLSCPFGAQPTATVSLAIG